MPTAKPAASEPAATNEDRGTANPMTRGNGGDPATVRGVVYQDGVVPQVSQKVGSEYPDIIIPRKDGDIYLEVKTTGMRFKDGYDQKLKPQAAFKVTITGTRNISKNAHHLLLHTIVDRRPASEGQSGGSAPTADGKAESSNESGDGRRKMKNVPVDWDLYCLNSLDGTIKIMQGGADVTQSIKNDPNNPLSKDIHGQRGMTYSNFIKNTQETPAEKLLKWNATKCADFLNKLCTVLSEMFTAHEQDPPVATAQSYGYIFENELRARLSGTMPTVGEQNRLFTYEFSATIEDNLEKAGKRGVLLKVQ